MSKGNGTGTRKRDLQIAVRQAASAEDILKNLRVSLGRMWEDELSLIRSDARNGKGQETKVTMAALFRVLEDHKIALVALQTAAMEQPGPTNDLKAEIARVAQLLTPKPLVT